MNEQNIKTNENERKVEKNKHHRDHTFANHNAANKNSITNTRLSHKLEKEAV